MTRRLNVLWGSYEFTEALLESVPIIVAELETGAILWASRPAEQLFGYPVLGELVGKQVEELMPEKFRQAHQHDRQVYAARPSRRAMGKREIPLTAVRRDGHEFPVEIALNPVMLEGRRVVIAVVMDMSLRSPPPAAKLPEESP